MPVKILYIIPRFTVGGAEKMVLQYARYFKARDFDITVASVVGRGELEQQFRDSGIEIFVAEKKSCFNLFKNYKYLKNIKKIFKPDIIHTHVFSADVAGYLLRRGVKWFSTQHNVGAEHSWFRKLVLRFILRRAEKIIAVSPVVADFCAQELRLKAEKMVLIKNGVEIEKWRALPAIDFGKESIEMAVIGRLEKQKGHIYLLRALAEIKNLPWHLHVYGEGSLEKELKQQAEDLKIAGNITWHGVKPDIASELKNIDAVIQPSLWEGRSLVIMEAMAAGRFVIASPAAGEELIQDKKTGIIVSVHQYKELAEAVRWVWQNREPAKTMVLAGRDYARENFSIEKNISALEKLYAE